MGKSKGSALDTGHLNQTKLRIAFYYRVLRSFFEDLRGHWQLIERERTVSN
jgi:hypothetical protein